MTAPYLSVGSLFLQSNVPIMSCADVVLSLSCLVGPEITNINQKHVAAKLIYGNTFLLRNAEAEVICSAGYLFCTEH